MKTNEKPRVNVTIRLHKSTIKDLEDFAFLIGGGKTRSDIIRRFIHYGFKSEGGWRGQVNLLRNSYKK